jgi:probable HAF family extracellular repeat protein
MDARYSPLLRAVGAVFLASSVLTVGCQETEEPTSPHVMAELSAEDPTITSVVPDSSPRGVTLNMTVNGTHFTQGSEVTLERQGVSAAGIRTNSTAFVSPRQLIANITIDTMADTGKYDVAVTSTGGRKGVGIELFAVEYTISELGILGGTWSEAHAVNDRGEIVGASCTQTCLSTAFYWSEETGQVDLGGLPGYSRSGAYAINSRGQVFGVVECWFGDAQCDGVFRRAMVRWDKTDEGWSIAPLEGCSVAMPLADGSERFLINDNDECVQRRSFSLVVQTISGTSVVSETILPSPYADGSDVANAINDAPMVAGYSSEVLERLSPESARLGHAQPVVWYRRTNGAWAYVLLGIPDNDLRAWATDLGNPDAGGRVRVVGFSEDWSSGLRNRNVIRAVRWTLQSDGAGGWEVAATEVLESARRGWRAGHAWPASVNDAGDVVGTAGAFLAEGSPVKWPIESGIQMLPVGKGGIQGRALDINNHGWIVGSIWDNSSNCTRASAWRLW